MNIRQPEVSKPTEVKTYVGKAWCEVCHTDHTALSFFSQENANGRAAHKAWLHKREAEQK